MTDKLQVLFLYTGNSCRGQMAEGWARHLRGDVVVTVCGSAEENPR